MGAAAAATDAHDIGSTPGNDVVIAGDDHVSLPDLNHEGALGWLNTSASAFYTGSQVGDTYHVKGIDPRQRIG